MAIYDSIEQTIGDMPLVRLNRINPPGTDIFVKIERTNPGGSIKDRAVLSIIKDAEARGVLKKGGTIVEPTSGNTGIAIAMLSAARGYKAVLVMPDTMSKERILGMKAYGAEVVLSPGAEGMKGAVELAERIASERDGFICDQFGNPENIAAHRTGTGMEILRDLPDVDYVFAGFGTGGTVSGIGKIFKDTGSKAKVIGVEPAESPLVSEGRAGPHAIQGIGSNFIPDNLDRDAIDDIVTVKGDDAIRTCVQLARMEGILCGISSGASVFAAIERSRAEPGKKIVAILPDGGEKYMSLGIFDE